MFTPPSLLRYLVLYNISSQYQSLTGSSEINLGVLSLFLGWWWEGGGGWNDCYMYIFAETDISCHHVFDYSAKVWVTFALLFGSLETEKCGNHWFTWGSSWALLTEVKGNSGIDSGRNFMKSLLKSPRNVKLWMV